MGIEFEANVAKLLGTISIEEAEGLFNWLLETKDAKMDVSQLDHLHTAVFQLLLILKPDIIGTPQANDLKMLLNIQGGPYEENNIYH
jgi:hypothetical protein